MKEDLEQKLIDAAALGNVGGVKDLLRQGNVKPKSEALLSAIENNHPDIVIVLLKDGRVNAAVESNSLMKWACKNGHEEIVLLVLNEKDVVADPNTPNEGNDIEVWVDIAADNRYYFDLAFEGGHAGVMKLLLENSHIVASIEAETLGEMFMDCSSIDMMKAFLNPQVAALIPKQLGTMVSLALPSVNGLDIVEALLENPQVAACIPPQRLGNTYASACINGKLDIVNAFLANPEVEALIPAKQLNQAFLYACIGNKPDIVKILLKNKRLNPVADKGSAIRTTETNGYGDIAIMVNNDPRVRFFNACIEGNIEGVKGLLKNPNLDPASVVVYGTYDDEKHMLQYAVTKNQTELVKLLLADKRIIPDKHTFINACTGGNPEIVKLLLEDDRVDPTVGLNSALVYGHTEVIKLLLDNPKAFPIKEIRAKTLSMLKNNATVDSLELLAGAGVDLQEGDVKEFFGQGDTIISPLSVIKAVNANEQCQNEFAVCPDNQLTEKIAETYFQFFEEQTDIIPIFTEFQFKAFKEYAEKEALLIRSLNIIKAVNTDEQCQKVFEILPADLIQQTVAATYKAFYIESFKEEPSSTQRKLFEQAAIGEALDKDKDQPRKFVTLPKSSLQELVIGYIASCLAGGEKEVMESAEKKVDSSRLTNTKVEAEAEKLAKNIVESATKQGQGK